MASQKNKTRCYDSIAWLSIDTLALPRNLVSFLKRCVSPNTSVDVFTARELCMSSVSDFAEYLEPFLFFTAGKPNGLAIIYQESSNSEKRDLALAEIIKSQTNWDILYISDMYLSNINIDYLVSKENIKEFIKLICSNEETQNK